MDRLEPAAAGLVVLSLGEERLVRVHSWVLGINERTVSKLKVSTRCTTFIHLYALNPLLFIHFTNSPAGAFLVLSASQAFSWPISYLTRMGLYTPYSYHFPLYSTEETRQGFTLLKNCHPHITCHSNVLQPCPLHQDVPRPYGTPSTLHSLPNNPSGRPPGSQQAPH